VSGLLVHAVIVIMLIVGTLFVYNSGEAGSFWTKCDVLGQEKAKLCNFSWHCSSASHFGHRKWSEKSVFLSDTCVSLVIVLYEFCPKN